MNASSEIVRRQITCLCQVNYVSLKGGKLENELFRV